MVFDVQPVVLEGEHVRLEPLSAKHAEGVFRNHMIVQQGHLRDSVYFSITEEDWPRVKAGLLEKLGRA